MDKDWDLYSDTNSTKVHSDDVEEFDKKRNFRRELNIIRENYSFNLWSPKYMEDT